MTFESPIISRRRALWMMGGVAGGLALHACTSSNPPTTDSADSSSELVKAKTGSTLWIGYTPMYIALEKGFFKELGLDLEYNIFGANSEGDVAFGSGQVDGQSTVTSQSVALVSKGVDYRIVQIADTSLGGDGILARNSIADVADFKGREIAVEVGAVSHFFLLQVLEEAGLSADDVTITNLTPDAAASAYTAGRVDIAVTYSPFLKQANDAQTDGRIIYDTSQMPTAIVDVYMFNTEFVDANPAAVQAHVDGIYRAIDFLETNRDEALELAGKWLELSPEDVAAELEGVDLTNRENNVKMLADESSDIYLVEHMSALGTFLKDQGQIETAPSLDELKVLMQPQFVEAALG